MRWVCVWRLYEQGLVVEVKVHLMVSFRRVAWPEKDIKYFWPLNSVRLGCCYIHLKISTCNEESVHAIIFIMDVYDLVGMIMCFR